MHRQLSRLFSFRCCDVLGVESARFVLQELRVRFGRDVREVRVPVVANGDILGIADAQRCLEASGADGVMIGRGAYGAPWLLGRIPAEANPYARPKAI